MMHIQPGETYQIVPITPVIKQNGLRPGRYTITDIKSINGLTYFKVDASSRSYDITNYVFMFPQSVEGYKDQQRKGMEDLLRDINHMEEKERNRRPQQGSRPRGNFESMIFDMDRSKRGYASTQADHTVAGYLMKCVDEEGNHVGHPVIFSLLFGDKMWEMESFPEELRTTVADMLREEMKIKESVDKQEKQIRSIMLDLLRMKYEKCVNDLVGRIESGAEK